MKIPTMNKMIKVYADAATIERLKCGRPTERTVRNTLAGYKIFRAWLNSRRVALGYESIGMDEDFPLVSIIKPVLIHKYLADLLKSDIKPVTAMSYLHQLQQLFARWIRPYYEDHGWKIPDFPSLGGRPSAPRYNRPDSEKLSRVKDWYRKLPADDSVKFQGRRNLVPSSQLWFATTMMLEFAMRNGDILRLSRDNFIERDGRVYLNYTPNKTKHSSGRMVKWPVHPDIWAKLRQIMGASNQLPPLDEELFDALNRQMRTLGFTGTKGAYELRKICIDHVYQKFGAEMATSISGDNIRTILHYYADPAQPNIGEIRVSDLL